MSMSAARRAWVGVGLSLALLLGTGLGAVVASPVAAAPVDSTEFVKYYTVTSSYQGAAENLTEIATRFLGSGSRSAEILNLNSGRQQPDGGTLVDPAKLHAGWSLVLPWDAVGAGVQNGLLPTAAPNPATTGGAGTPKTPRPTVKPSGTKRPTTGAAGDQCAAASSTNTQSDWASLRLAPDQAWSHSRGKGELIAVIDSGADGSLPQLTGHVTVGADIVTGSGRGDTDCLGSGTAMAGLIVAQSTQSSALTGVAPDATVMPVRVVTTSPTAKPADEATAIEVAASAGATVIALGSYVNPNDPTVAAAIKAAASHDVVVVGPAPGSSAPVDPAAGAPPKGTIRVGGVGVDGQSAAAYRPGAVDVVAPGINVTSLGVTGAGALNGTGTQYAVAFVAGEAALVRAAYPDLTAAQVVHRVEVTSDKMGDTGQDSGHGYGLINPGNAVTRTLPEEARSAPAVQATYTTPTTGNRSVVLVLIALVGLAAAVLLVLRIRRLMQAAPDEHDAPDPAKVAQMPVAQTPVASAPQPPANEGWSAPRHADGGLSDPLAAAGIRSSEESGPKKQGDPGNG